ncbi:tannase/feruloyl esterase family alpha/beta hydrolase [Streptomyces sp. NPDC051985]|uniref:tannase/feruloyl esterase family alpha/beta hydrolase n=1 Tax=Streptomyces sp. NPDC051985 TaxID=3155807 RepID=UPI0034225187
MDDVRPDGSVAGRCSVDGLQAAVSGVDGARVVSAAVNRTGMFRPPRRTYEPIPNLPMLQPEPVGELPDFCDVRVHVTGPGGHVAEVFVWVPLAWNGRFLGTQGGSSVTGPMWHDLPVNRIVSMAHALRNGFATAATDGGNRDTRFLDWPLDRTSGELDWELIRNWAYRSTHDMTVVAKAVTTALCGAAPRYSYLQGCSGGGRQAMASAQRYPADYDGIWASDGVLNWTRCIGAGLWPALVMKELGNPVPAAKLDAFRAAVLESNDGTDGVRDGYLGLVEPTGFDPSAVVGTRTSAGVITETDAEVVRMIWAGPTRTDGTPLWFGLHPSAVSWGGYGLCDTEEVDGTLRPVPFRIAESHFRWIARDPGFDWTTLTFETYPEMFDRGVRELAEIASDDPDLSALRASGGKLIISQAVEDSIILYQGAVDYYRRVVEAVGGQEDTASFCRLFLSDGDLHGQATGPGCGLTMSNGMAALMEWTENGVAPDMIVTERFDPLTSEVLATRPLFAYPNATAYSGSGDPADAASYTATRL